MSCKKIADSYGVGKTQIQSIFKRKLELLEEAEKGLNPACKRYKVVSENSDIEEKTFVWYCLMEAMKFPVTSATLQETASKIANQQGIDHFKGSNGWLDRFRRRHSILAERLRGERGCVDGDYVEDFKEQLPAIICDYRQEDIFSADEIGICFRAIPERSSCDTITVKDRITLLLCVSAAGLFEKPVLIGTSEFPRCLQNVSVSSLSYTWRSNPNAWITEDLFRNWLLDFNARMASQCRNVVLLLDKSPIHPHLALSNVRIVFSPQNTPVAQPLQQGVIRIIIKEYQKRLLQCVIRKAKNCGDSASTIQKFIDLHLAITWILESIAACKPETIKKCFRKCGVDGGSLSATSSNAELEPIESDMELLEEDKSLLQLLLNAKESLQIKEMLSLEDYTDLMTNTKCVELFADHKPNEESEQTDNISDDVTSSMTPDDAQEAFDALRRYFVSSGFSKSNDALMNAWKVFENEISSTNS